MTSPSVQSDFVAVIRTTGERTFETCRRLVLEQMPETRLHVVKEYPFEAALRRCYEIGLNSGAEWMVTIDADVLLKRNAIASLLEEAAAMPENHFQMEGMVLDKLTRRFRWAGYRAYRVRHLDAAWKLLPADRAEIRPESSTLDRMAAQGYPYLRSRRIYGVHDYEQYLRDIYRKAYVHASKHPQWLPELLATWKNLARSDVDLRVALAGAHDGLLAHEEPRIDTRDFLGKTEEILAKLGLEEKEALASDGVVFETIDELIGNAIKSPEIKEVAVDASPPSQLARLFSGLGPIRILPYLAGAVLCRLGDCIKRLAKGKGAE